MWLQTCYLCLSHRLLQGALITAPIAHDEHTHTDYTHGLWEKHRHTDSQKDGHKQIHTWNHKHRERDKEREGEGEKEGERKILMENGMHLKLA